MFTDEDDKSVWWHQWEPTNIGETIFDLSTLANADGKPDFTKIKAIKFTNRETARKWDEGTSKYVEDNDNSAAITFGTITMTIQVDGYDELINTYDKKSFTVSDERFNLDFWGDTNSKDTGNNAFTLANDGNSVGWDYYWSGLLDISGYDRLVVKVKNVTDSKTLYFRIFGKNGSGNDANGNYQVELSSGNSYTANIDLTGGLTTNNDLGGGSAEALDLSKICSLRFWAWAGEVSATIDELYLERDGEVHLLRNNTTADKYGTICLPFAASKPGNATVYEVVGYAEENSAPKTVYLQTVDALEAGKAYLFKSSDANDITFTKTGTDANLSSPASPSYGLIGYFDAATRYVPKDSYILVSGKWKKVTVANQNQVGLYRGYLTLTDDLKVNTTEARSLGYIDMDVDGTGTTVIAEVSSSKAQVSSTDVYNLQGRRVSQPTKGLYIVNGKKVIIK